MSDNDLISRMALYEKTAKWEALALHMVEIHMHDEDTTEWRKWSTILIERSAFKFDVADAPAVPQEMTAREFFKEFQRMCLTVDGCSDCPILGIDTCAGFPCRYRAYLNPDKAVAIVEKWAQEHPERSEE